jgi:hypothetical protein
MRKLKDMEIRRAQLAALGRVRLDSFAADCAEVLRAQFPARTKSLSDEDLLEHVHDCIRRANDYGLESERDVQRFVNLAGAFGWDFDQTPEHAWMKGYLTDETVSSPSQRIERLVAESLRRLGLEAKNRAAQRAFE